MSLVDYKKVIIFDLLQYEANAYVLSPILSLLLCIFLTISRYGSLFKVYDKSPEQKSNDLKLVTCRSSK